MLPTVNSFDVFDTLLARKVLNPCDIFSIVEFKFPYPNFRSKRGNAQNNSNGTIKDTYIKFRELYEESEEVCNKLMEFEIQTEIDYSYLIQTNCNRVKDGDILISDMYLTGEQIMRILNSHGFTKQVKMFASPCGKSSGAIWPILKQQYSIQLHLGDNPYSDITMANNANIEAEHTTIHAVTTAEQFFIHNNETVFALLLRQFRHMNPHNINTKEYNLYNDQAEFNIPLLILCSNHLYNILKAENRTTLLLTTRDGCLLKHIFPLLYPEITCIELHASRQVYRNPTEEYKNYLRSIYTKDTCLIFDVYGAFCSGRELFKNLFGAYPRVHLLGYDSYFKGSEPYSGLTYSSKKCFEGYNIDCVGSLLKLEDNHFIRPPVIEYDSKNAILYKETVLSFCAFIQSYMKAIPRSSTLLEKFIKSITREHQAHHYEFTPVQQKINQVAPLWNHQGLTTMADILNVTKGSSTGCGHRYTEYYEVLLEPWYNNPCSILEIGLQGYGTQSIPSLDLWKAYMCRQTKVYGFDTNPEFVKFHNPSDTIYIHTNLEQAITATYDCIIDDGDHSSRSQQIMFKALWPSLNSGGIYCIESLHWQPSNDYGMKTVDLFVSWKNEILQSSEFISLEEATVICSQISKIEFYPSKSSKWNPALLKNAFVVIHKKSY